MLWRTLVAVVLLGCGRTDEPAGQDSFGASLLQDVRRAALMVPGDLPRSVGVIVVHRFERSAALMAEGARDEPIPVVRAAYQVRYPNDWIMVDSGHGPEFDPQGLVPSAELYAHLQAALRGARMVVFTHEHLDHVGGAVRSPYPSELARSVLLTSAQRTSLINELPESLIRLDSAAAANFVVTDYAPLMPIAPGVVLIKAPGHTLGSQMIYVRLENGAEIVLAGDVSNFWSAVVEGRQKPPRPDLAEDRDAIAVQMAWLREVAASGLHVLLAHDDAALKELIEDGVIQPDVELEREATPERR